MAESDRTLQALARLAQNPDFEHFISDIILKRLDEAFDGWLADGQNSELMRGRCQVCSEIVNLVLPARESMAKRISSRARQASRTTAF